MNGWNVRNFESLKIIFSCLITTSYAIENWEGVYVDHLCAFIFSYKTFDIKEGKANARARWVNYHKKWFSNTQTLVANNVTVFSLLSFLYFPYYRALSLIHSRKQHLQTRSIKDLKLKVFIFIKIYLPDTTSKSREFNIR